MAVARFCFVPYLPNFGQTTSQPPFYQYGLGGECCSALTKRRLWSTHTCSDNPKVTAKKKIRDRIEFTRGAVYTLLLSPSQSPKEVKTCTLTKQKDCMSKVISFISIMKRYHQSIDMYINILIQKKKNTRAPQNQSQKTLTTIAY